MNPNKLTHGHNLLWESSRMMLPEHKELIQQHQKQLNQKTKPELDEQEVEWLEHQIQEAIRQQSTIRFNLYNPYETRTVVGTIQKVDLHTQQLKLLTPNGDIEWFSLSDLVSIQ